MVLDCWVLRRLGVQGTSWLVGEGDGGIQHSVKGSGKWFYLELVLSSL